MNPIPALSIACFFLIRISFSQNNSLCFNGVYYSGGDTYAGGDTIYIGIESKSVHSKKYTSQFIINYVVHNKPDIAWSQFFYCKQVDSVFYLTKDSTYFNLRRFQGYYNEDKNMIITDGSFMSFVPDKKNILIEDWTPFVHCGDNGFPNAVIEDNMYNYPEDVAIEEVTVEFCEIEPSFPGGEDSLKLFLKTNLIYPEMAKQAGIQGVVYIQFFVEKDGTLTGTRILKGVDPNIDREALRLVSIMPKWISGQWRGQPTGCKYTIPVNFKIE